MVEAMIFLAVMVTVGILEHFHDDSSANEWADKEVAKYNSAYAAQESE